MLVFGFFGELGVYPLLLGLLGVAAWGYIIYEIFLGEASKISAESGTAASQMAFNALRLIVTIGWAIYPIGYFLGIGEAGSADALNIIYNLADFVNKIAFGVVIWVAATSSSSEKSA